MTDRANRVTEIERRVTIDSQPPAVSFLAPSPSLATAGRPTVPTVNGMISLQGNASDNNTISKLEYKLGSAAWAEFGTELYAFTLSINTNALADTADYIVQVRATDVAGNLFTGSSTMYVDQASDLPRITFNGVSTANAAAQNLFLDEAKLQGWVEDDDGSIAGVEVSVDGGSYAAVSNPPVSPSTFFEQALTDVAAG